MARKLNEELSATWRERIERQRGSGETVAEFCGHEGVSTANYYHWQRKLRTSQPARSKGVPSRRKTASAKRRRRDSSDPPARIPFVQLPLTTPAACPWIEVVLAEGTIVRIPQQNLAALRAVLGSLGNGMESPSIEETRHA